MALVAMDALLSKARTGNYAVGMFDFYDVESLEAICDAAEHLRSPVIIGVVTPLLHRLTVRDVVSLACSLARGSRVQMAVHLDHGRKIEVLEEAMEAGATSLMFDGSSLPFEENLAGTLRLVRAAHARGVTTEAELGYVGAADGQAAAVGERPRFTDPGQVRDFVQGTGVDALAIAVGNLHGIYRSPPSLDFGLIERIQAQTDAHLVLHGASGIPAPDVRRAIALGIRKVNYFTEVACAAHDTLRGKLCASPDPFPFFKIIPEVRQSIQSVVEAAIRIMGSEGRSG